MTDTYKCDDLSDIITTAIKTELAASKCCGSTDGETGGEANDKCGVQNVVVNLKDCDGNDEAVTLTGTVTKKVVVDEDEASLLDGLNIFAKLEKAKQTSSWKFGRTIAWIIIAIISFITLKMIMDKVKHATRPIRKSSKSSSGMDPMTMMMLLNSSKKNDEVEYI